MAGWGRTFGGAAGGLVGRVCLVIGINPVTLSCAVAVSGAGAYSGMQIGDHLGSGFGELLYEFALPDIDSRVNDLTLFKFIVLVAAGIFFLAGVTCVLALILAPFVIDRADRHFHSLKLGQEPLFKGYPFSVARMSHYGFIMLFQRTKLIKLWVLSGREDRVEAIKTAPSWLQYLMVLVYSGFVICTVTSFVLISLLLVVDRYWR